MPLLPARPIFHSSSSSKSPNSSLVIRSPTCPSFARVLSTIFQPSGILSLLYPRQASSDLPSKSVCQEVDAGIADCGLRIADSGLRIADWIADCGITITAARVKVQIATWLRILIIADYARFDRIGAAVSDRFRDAILQN